MCELIVICQGLVLQSVEPNLGPRKIGEPGVSARGVAASGKSTMRGETLNPHPGVMNSLGQTQSAR